MTPHYHPESDDMRAIRFLCEFLFGERTPLSAARQEGEDLVRSLARVERRIFLMSESLNAKVGTLEAKIDELNGKADSAVQRDKVNADAMDALRQELADLKAVVVPLPVDTTAVEARIDAMVAKIDAVDTKLDAIDAPTPEPTPAPSPAPTPDPTPAPTPDPVPTPEPTPVTTDPANPVDGTAEPDPAA